MLGFWINYAVNQTISDKTHTQWIVPLGLQLVPGVLLFLGIFWCPETPRVGPPNPISADVIMLSRMTSGTQSRTTGRKQLKSSATFDSCPQTTNTSAMNWQISGLNHCLACPQEVEE